MSKRTIVLGTLSLVFLGACASSTPPLTPAPETPALQQPEAVTLGVPVDRKPTSKEFASVFSISSSASVPAPSPVQQTSTRMLQNLNALFSSSNVPQGWTDLLSALQRSPMMSRGMVVSPKQMRRIVEQSQNGTAAVQGQGVSSEVFSSLSKIGTQAIGDNLLPTGTWKPRVGTDPSNPSNYEQVSTSPARGFKVEARLSGKTYVLETNWEVGGSPTVMQPLTLGATTLTQELPTSASTMLTQDGIPLLRVGLRVNYGGECFSYLGPTSFALDVAVPQFLTLNTTFSRGVTGISGSLDVTVSGTGHQATVKMTGNTLGTVVVTDCQLSLTPANVQYAGRVKVDSDQVIYNAMGVNLSGIKVRFGKSLPLEVVQPLAPKGVVMASVRQNTTTLLSAFGPLEDGPADADTNWGDQVKVQFTDGTNLYTTTLQQLLTGLVF